MLKDFKAFILKGSLIEIAVGLIMALAFFAVVTAFIADIITPLIAAIAGKPDFGNLRFTVNHSTFRYGDFVNVVITFVIIAAVMFLLLKVASRLMQAKDATEKDCTFCKESIPVAATRCPHCTSELALA